MDKLVVMEEMMEEEMNKLVGMEEVTDEEKEGEVQEEEEDMMKEDNEKEKEEGEEEEEEYGCGICGEMYHGDTAKTCFISTSSCRCLAVDKQLLMFSCK